MIKLLQIVLCCFAIYSVNGNNTYDEWKAVLPARSIHKGRDAKYLNEPGLKFEPDLATEKDLIHFKFGLDDGYSNFVGRLKYVMANYTNEAQLTKSPDIVDCEMISEYKPLDFINNSCRFDTYSLGYNCVQQAEYGYADGQPCIAIFLERITNWLPEPYENKSEVPDKIIDDWTKYAITVHCEGEDPVSKDNIGSITYYPSGGLHYRYFPNTGRADWIDPLVFVQLESLTPAVAVRVTCSVWAKNIIHDERFNTGKVSFDIMVD